MPKTKYENYSKDQLIEELKKLNKRKRYGLVWEEEKTKENFEAEAEGKLPVLVEDKTKEVKNNSDNPTNILIEGDNYHALSVLSYTHAKGVDVMYFDPPYNTGNKSWRYNNNYIERDDPFKHSKWLSFMKKRLKLARNLLKKEGIIFVCIDDYEVFQLGMLLDEIFGENNRLAVVTVLNKKSGRTTDKFFATCHEYYLVYAKDITYAKIEMFELNDDSISEYKFQDKVSPYKWRDFLRTGGFSTPKERPNSYYPIYFNEKKNIITVEKIAGAVEIFPIDTKGNKRVWRQTRPSLMNLVENGDIKIEKNKKGKYLVRIKDRIKIGTKPKTVWDSPKYDAASHGTKLLESILGESKMFDFPKSVFAVYDALQIVTKNIKNAVVLDIFAGSGTTGHAVLELNKMDNGSRQFILCTNNENNICTDVCYPRIKKVIRGYTSTSGEKVKGLGGNLKYYKTNFVGSEPTHRNKKQLTAKSIEMLCIRENTFNEVLKKTDISIFKSELKYTAILFDEMKLNEFKRLIEKYDLPVSVYIFSLEGDDFSEEFEDLKNNITLCSIPEAILKVYRRIYGMGQMRLKI